MLKEDIEREELQTAFDRWSEDIRDYEICNRFKNSFNYIYPHIKAHGCADEFEKLNLEKSFKLATQKLKDLKDEIIDLIKIECKRRTDELSKLEDAKINAKKLYEDVPKQLNDLKVNIQLINDAFSGTGYTALSNGTIIRDLINGDLQKILFSREFLSLIEE